MQTQMQRIYLDYNASTPLDPRLRPLLIQELEEDVGNPSSVHFYGQQRRRKLEESRQIIARFFRVRPNEVIFTSGGTEGASLLLRGVVGARKVQHIISSSAEHSCVYRTLQDLQDKGTDVTFLAAGEWGAVSPEAVEQAITPQTGLITLMAVNNETGVKTNLDAIAKIAEERNIPLIVDGVAWLGKDKIVLPSGVSAAFFSGHKIYAPKGVGFCICRSHLKISPLFIGGHQEKDRRAGTENLSAIVILGEAINLLEKELEASVRHMSHLRDLFEKEVFSRIANVAVNGQGERICNTSNLAFLGRDGEALLIQLDLEGIAVSHGSACAAGTLEPSRILLGMGMPLSQAQSSLRFSFGKTTTEAEIYRLVTVLGRLCHI